VRAANRPSVQLHTERPAVWPRKRPSVPTRPEAITSIPITVRDNSGRAGSERLGFPHLFPMANPDLSPLRGDPFGATVVGVALGRKRPGVSALTWEYTWIAGIDPIARKKSAAPNERQRSVTHGRGWQRRIRPNTTPVGSDDRISRAAVGGRGRSHEGQLSPLRQLRDRERPPDDHATPSGGLVSCRIKQLATADLDTAIVRIARSL
jgi:hypothetical protein